MSEIQILKKNKHKLSNCFFILWILILINVTVWRWLWIIFIAYLLSFDQDEIVWYILTRKMNFVPFQGLEKRSPMECDSKNAFVFQFYHTNYRFISNFIHYCVSFGFLKKSLSSVFSWFRVRRHFPSKNTYIVHHVCN